MDGSVDIRGSPADRAYREAGPPAAALFMALAIGTPVTAWSTSLVPGIEPWLFVGVTIGGLTGLVALADRDGWRTRAGMAYVAQEQDRRWADRSLPSSEEDARNWLADPTNDSASPIDRSSVLSLAGEWQAARELIASTTPESASDRVRKVRALAWIDGQTSGVFDIDPIRLAATVLPPAEARYHVAAALWSRACIDVASSRPWRHPFAAGIAALGPLPLSRYTRLQIAIRQLAAPITALIASAIVVIATTVFPTSVV